MSKGNLFLGMGRGKVGDVVFYRADGEQITRTRNRHPRNPNTNAQIIQRAVMADVQRVYSLGYQLFNHAFQGYRVGAENQRRFIKVNADKIRKAVLAALNGSTSPIYLGAPGILSPVPNEYIVSEGNYDQTLLSIDATTPANPKWVLPSAGSATTIGEYAAAHGLVDGDIYTIVGIFTKSDTMDYEYFDENGQFVEEASVRKANFAYLQLRVKEGTQASTAAYSSSTQWDDIFDEAHGTTGSKTVAEGLDMVDISGIDGSGAWTVIRSRENEDLRSSSTLQLFGEQSGVTPEWLFRVWSKEATNLASDLTLEGADFNGAGADVPVRPTILGVYYDDGSDTQDWPTTDAQTLIIGSLSIDCETDYVATAAGEDIPSVKVQVRYYAEGAEEPTAWEDKAVFKIAEAGTQRGGCSVPFNFSGYVMADVRILNGSEQYKAILSVESGA